MNASGTDTAQKDLARQDSELRGATDAPDRLSLRQFVWAFVWACEGTTVHTEQLITPRAVSRGVSRLPRIHSSLKDGV